MSKLTAVEVRNAKPKDKAYKLADGHGMHLHISATGIKSWRYRYRIAGNESTFTLGQYPEMTLEKARSARMGARAKVVDGTNPAEERRKVRQEKTAKVLAARERQNNTFEYVALEWINQQRDRWSKPHADAVLATLRADAFPSIGDRPIDTIQPPMILLILRSIESRGAGNCIQSVATNECCVSLCCTDRQGHSVCHLLSVLTHLAHGVIHRAYKS